MAGDDGMRPQAAATEGSTQASLPAGQAQAQGQSQALPGRGSLIGPFLVVDFIGSGAMANVLSAYDPALDRKVALKLLRSVGRTPTELRRARLQREAQAMARLNHPNVVAVHQVGDYGDQIYVAMEFVDGETLGSWLRQRRPLREVLAAFLAAGRGLAAAHEAGLVHRDFKPDNVLVGKDGRVRVGDFGLAAAGNNPSSDGELGPSPGTALTAALTVTGVRLGTPAYMSPEQHAGGAVDARADQFAFCVTLYEGLYRELPFSGKDQAELAENVRHGRLRPPPRDAGPSWVRLILLRGLAADPAARYPSMDALLDALERGPRRVWRWVAAAAVVVGLAAGGIVAARRAGASPCRDAASRLAGVWDAEVRSAVQQRFLASGRAYAAQVYENAAQALDAYAAAWTRMRFEACEATAVRHEQSETLLDARMRCLDGRLGSMRALTQVFREGDAVVVDRAIQAAQALEPVAGCADPAQVLAVVPPPTDPVLRARIEAVHARIDTARALERSGQPRKALPLVPDLLADVRALGYRPLEADALATVAFIDMYTRDAKTAASDFEAALQAASEVHDDPMAARILTQLIFIVGAKGGRFAEGLALRPAAEAAVRRAGGSDVLESQLLYTVGVTYSYAGQYSEALEVHERALALRERMAPDSLEVGKSLIGAGVALTRLHRLPEGRVRLERALAIYQRALAPDHFETAPLLGELGTNAFYSGDLPAAESYYRRAVEIFEHTIGTEDSRFGGMLANLANAVGDQGRLDEARALYQRALTAQERTYGPDHPEVAMTLQNLAELDADAGRFDDARAGFAKAIAITEAKLGKDAPRVSKMLQNLGGIEMRAGRYEAARTALERAVAINEKALAPDDPNVAETYATLGRCQLLLGHAEQARATLERALAGIGEAGLPEMRAEVRFSLAKALVATGKDAARADPLAREALKIYADLPAKAENRRVVEEWLRKRH